MSESLGVKIKGIVKYNVSFINLHRPTYLRDDKRNATKYFYFHQNYCIGSPKQQVAFAFNFMFLLKWMWNISLFNAEIWIVRAKHVRNSIWTMVKYLIILETTYIVHLHTCYIRVRLIGSHSLLQIIPSFCSTTFQKLIISIE